MTHSRRFLRLGTAVVIGLATTVLAAGAALAHPESEGSHTTGCIVTVEPGSVAVGGQFTVAIQGFSGASIYILKGAGTGPAEGATPNTTTPEGPASFSVTFTAEAADVGTLTVWGLLPESECGDSDQVVVTAAVPNTAVAQPPVVVLLGWLAVAVACALGLRQMARQRR